MMRTYLKSMRSYLALGLASIVLLACAAGPQEQIAPQGTLKMGLYKGSPTSYLEDGNLLQNRGIGFMLGKQLATYSKLPYQPVVYGKNADVLDAVRDDRVDLVFTNATPARAKFIQFSEPVLKLEKGFLLAPKSKVKSIADLNRSDVKVGISVGSSSEKELPEILSKTVIVKMNSTKETIEALTAGKIDAFSTNKAILFELSDQVPGSRVMPEVIAYESIALGVPIGRPNVKPYLDQFIQSLQNSGELDIIIRNSGLRGVAK